MTATRVYKLAPNPEGLLLQARIEDALLIEASSEAQAYRHVARKTWIANIANQFELIELVGRGVKVEKASPD